MRTSGRWLLTGIVIVGVAVTVACGNGTTSPDNGLEDAGDGTGDGSVGPQADGGIVAKDAGGKDSGSDAGPIACKTGADCPSKVCNPNKTCAASTCSDGVVNQTETDLDCGGTCPACDVLKKCKTGVDCTSKVCADKGTGLLCQAPTSMDGVQNGTETDVDCGGMGNPMCVDGKKCVARGDCASDVCVGGKCITPVCNDGIQNGSETAIDCGGLACPRCADNLGCQVAGDCIDGVCADVGAGLACQPPTFTDGVQNGTETDVDCGGSGDPALYGCAPTKACKADTDCTSDGCDFTKHCAIHRSCTGNSTGGHYGVDTCGLGGPGGIGPAQWESCCSTVDVTVTEGTPAVTRTVHMDKYKVTAGRMRAFLESVNGDVRGFIQTARAAGQVPVLPVTAVSNPVGTTVLPPMWDQYLPTSTNGDGNEPADCDQGGWDTTNLVCKPNTTYAPMYTAARQHVGPTIFKANSQTLQGCNYGAPGTHTYYEGSPDYYNQTPDFDQTIYDQKPLQCVDYLVAQAFCIWDGGRLETTQEWYAAWTASTMPWTNVGLMNSQGTSGATLLPKTDLPSANPVACPTAGVGAPQCADGSGNPGGKCGAGLTCTPVATYTACRFPTATDLLLNTQGYINMTGCAAWTIPNATHTIEFADYQYNYEWPTLKTSDFAVFISPPGRTLGRAPSGAADIVGTLFEVSSNLSNYTDVPFPTKVPAFAGSKVSWSGSGSWEVHGTAHSTTGNGAYNILDKYGKMGLRCIHE